MNIQDFMIYPAIIEQSDDGSYSINIRGLPHSHSCADTYEEALEMAKELIIDCVTFDAGHYELPKGDQPQSDEIAIHISPDVAIKIMLRNAMLEKRINVHQLAEKIGEPDSKVRNTLNFRRATKLETIMKYFQAINCPLSISC